MSVPNEYFVPTCWIVAMSVLVLLMQKYLRKRNVVVSREFRLSLPLQKALATLDRMFADKYECKLLEREGSLRLYARGDRSLLRVDCKEMTQWRRIPALISVRCYRDRVGQTRVRIAFCSWGELSLTMRAAGSFGKMAKLECLAIQKEAQEESDEPSSTPGAAKKLDVADACAALRLQPGATWLDVRAAFHYVCTHCHPDKLAQLKASPKLIEAAAGEFKTKTEAYRVLKEYFSRKALAQQLVVEHESSREACAAS